MYVYTSYQVCPKGTPIANKARAINVAHNETECSNQGICDRDRGECVCYAGFEGKISITTMYIFIDVRAHVYNQYSQSL